METLLIIQGCFGIFEQCLHRAKAFSACQPTPLVSRMGVHKGLGGGTARTLTPADPKDNSGQTVSYLAHKEGERRRVEGLFGVKAFSF